MLKTFTLGTPETAVQHTVAVAEFPELTQLNVAPGRTVSTFEVSDTTSIGSGSVKVKSKQKLDPSQICMLLSESRLASPVTPEISNAE